MSDNSCRAPDGRFLPGCPPGPGNPHAGSIAKYRRILYEVVGEDKMCEILTKLVEKARGGDLVAIRLLLERVMGKPSDALTKSLLDEEVSRRLDLSKMSTATLQELLRLGRAQQNEEQPRIGG